MFFVTIQTDNEAFSLDWQSEVSRILRDLADKLDRSDGRDDKPSGKCFDHNGNGVGSWSKE